MREAWQKKKLILKVALKLNKKIASLVVHIDWYLFLLKILLLQRYKKKLRFQNFSKGFYELGIAFFCFHIPNEFIPQFLGII